MIFVLDNVLMIFYFLNRISTNKFNKECIKKFCDDRATLFLYSRNFIENIRVSKVVPKISNLVITQNQK